jgi:hypothetical protein
LVLIYDSTEEAIQKMIEASQSMISEQNNNPIINEHFKRQIKTLLQNACLEEMQTQVGTAFENKRKKAKAGAYAHIEDTQKDWLQKRD